MGRITRLKQQLKDDYNKYDSKAISEEEMIKHLEEIQSRVNDLLVVFSKSEEDIIILT